MSRASRPVVVLSAAVAAMSLAAALVGLLATGGEAPRAVTSVHGEVVELYGIGTYRNDTVFKGAGNRGSDLVTLVLGVPLLVVATALYRRGSPHGAFLLSGALCWPLYLYATMAVGTAYNDLFLLYVAIFSASLFALVLAALAIDRPVLSDRMGVGGPWRGTALLMLVSGTVTAVVWLAPLAAATTTGEVPPLLGHQTTMVTEALDLAVITPATLMAAYLLRHRRVEGYLIAFPLLVLLMFLLPMIMAQTWFQLGAGVSITVAEVVGPVGGFMVLAVVAAGVARAVLRAAGVPLDNRSGRRGARRSTLTG